MRPLRSVLPVLLLAAAAGPPAASGAERMLDAEMHHLRSGGEREWAEFPKRAEAEEYTLEFSATANSSESSLWLRHRDVKRSWILVLNGERLGRLPRNENEMLTCRPVPAGTLREGENRLRIAPESKASDDVLIGEVRLDDRPRAEALAEATVHVSVTDAETGEPLPCRLTLVDRRGILVTTGAESGGALAVRPGVIYSATGEARVPLPAGRYTLYAGRGFEYGLASVELELNPGETVSKRLCIRREVPTDGYVSCDPHVHTVTHSGHGDASIEERMITLAGEGIELPVATDHNVQIDYDPTARSVGVRRYFTPIIGNEVTTRNLGHFNVFPIEADAPVVDHTGEDWPAVFESIRKTPGVQVVVLNHPGDIHGGFRPFGPKHHISVTGDNLDGRRLRANAMEVVNSAAMQTDGLQLFRDWFGLLNRGLTLTPIGSSDSHDVSRHFVGQGRTYIRCDDADPAAIDVDAACRNLVAGRVLVSLGLLCTITVDGEHGPGDLVRPGEQVSVTVRVLGPSWTRAERIVLYANGRPVREAEIAPDSPAAERPGLKWEQTWTLAGPKHDIHLAAVATGPGIEANYWPIAKPYQPDSIEWQPYVLGATGAVYVDADGSGEFDSARDYATRLFARTEGKPAPLLRGLCDYDAAVAAQAAELLRADGVWPFDEQLQEALAEHASPAVRSGFEAYRLQWRESKTARSRR